MQQGHVHLDQVQRDDIQLARIRLEMAIRQIQEALLAKAFEWVHGCLSEPYGHRQDLT